MTTNNNIMFYEVFMQRPYEVETLYSILTNIAALSSRGAVIFETRCKNGTIRYLLGTPRKSVGRVQEVFKAHSKVQFADVSDREPVGDARKIRITKPVLSLNTEVFSAMVRATLAAMMGAKTDTETVVQITFGAAFAPKAIPKNIPDPNTTYL